VALDWVPSDGPTSCYLLCDDDFNSRLKRACLQQADGPDGPIGHAFDYAIGLLHDACDATGMQPTGDIMLPWKDIIPDFRKLHFEHSGGASRGAAVDGGAPIPYFKAMHNTSSSRSWGDKIPLFNELQGLAAKVSFRGEHCATSLTRVSSSSCSRCSDSISTPAAST
jgi:hypothetical protein